MDISLYWGMEYTKVLLGYIFIMFLWPSVVFRRFFRGKSLIFHFSFCVTLQVVLVNTVVLLLGLIHLLHPWVFRTLFYGSFLWSAFRNVRFGKKELKTFRHLLTGTLGFRQFLFKVTTKIEKKGEQVIQNFRTRMHSHWWECGLLAIIVIFGMMYFSHGALQDYSYGFGDMYPHNAWTYSLTQGQVFSAGIYPEAMHCFLYALHVLFGIRIYSALLFLAGVHVATYLISAYVLMRQIFRWRYSPMLALTLFLTVDLLCVDEVFSMSRLQWTLPQEFGLYTLFISAAFLIRYAHSEKRIMRRGKLSKKYWDENLLVFSLGLAASLTIHFYTTIMAFFLCASFVPVLMGRIFNRKRFWPLVVAVLSGFFIAVAPMGGALLSGIHFQGSIYWAMNVINGTDPEQAWTPPAEETEEPPQEAVEGAVGDLNQSDATGQNPGSTGQVTGSEEIAEQEEPGLFVILIDRLRNLGVSLGNRLQKAAKGIWRYSYATLYREERATWLVGFTVLDFALWLFCRFLIPLINLVLREKRIPGNYFDQYFSIALASFIFMFMYSSKYIGLPPLIAESRLCSTGQMLNLAMMVVPFDWLFHVIGLVLPQGIMKLVSALCVGGIYVGTILTDTFHGYLYFEFTRYNEAVMTTISITQTLPDGSYTIVSPVDELYQLVQYGWHEELVNFVNESFSEDYTLPSRYVFLYIEKKPIQYGQSHFFTGPDWLATEKYTQYYSYYVSQCPHVNSSEISEEFAMNSMDIFPLSSSVYSNMVYRTILESRLYKWCEQFQKMYPNELKVYYETDNFVCYYFEQNVQRLYQLGIMQ